MNRLSIMLLALGLFSLAGASPAGAFGFKDAISGVSDALDVIGGDSKSEPADKAGEQPDEEEVALPSESPAAGIPRQEVSKENLRSLTQQAQQLLNERGFAAGPADGAAGPKTRDAICQFQLAADLPVDPKVTPGLVEALQDSSRQLAPQDYNELYQQQCGIAHLNNLNNLEPAAYHSYEGALSVEDSLCQQLVAPFELTSNFDFLMDTVKDTVSSPWTFFGQGENKKAGDVIDLKQARDNAKKANWMPVTMEKAYGESLHEAKLELGARLLDRDSKRSQVRAQYEKADALLENTLSTLPADLPYQFKLLLVDDREPNAEALPGGFLYVNTGVLDTDYAELVMGHEIAHVLQRHTTRELQAQLVDSVTTVDELRGLIKDGGKPSVDWAGEVLRLRGAFAQYSQNQELQSDACAVRIAAVPSTDLQPAIAAYIVGLESGTTKLRKATTTHPAYPERRMRMLKVASSIESKPTLSEK